MADKIMSIHEDVMRQQKKAQDNQKQKQKGKKLATLIFRLAVKIIQYSQQQSSKLRKVNSNQMVLFPTSQRTIQSLNSEHNQNLINEYKKKTENWYPFYLSDCSMYIDNHHLQLFQKRSDLPGDLTAIGFGKIVCFSEKVGFIQGNRKVKEIINVDPNFIESPQKQEKQPPSYFWRSSKTQQYETNTQIFTKNVVFFGTDLGYIIGTDPQTNFFNSFKIFPKVALKSVCLYKNYVMGTNSEVAQFLKIDMTKQRIKMDFLFQVNIDYVGFVSKNYFIKHKQLFYMFFIDEEGLKKMILKQRKLMSVQQNSIMAQSAKFNKFVNLKIFHQGSGNNNRVVLIVSSTKQMMVLSYSPKDNTHVVLHKMQNPPQTPKMYNFSCIQYFSTACKQESTRNSQRRQSNYSAPRNSNLIQSLKQTQTGEDYLLAAVSFTERLYFIKIYELHCEISKRAKFSNQIVKIQSYNGSGIILVMHKNPLQTLNLPQVRNMGPNYEKLIFVATQISRIMSFNMSVNTHIAQKIEYQIIVPGSMNSNKRFVASFAMINSDCLILTQKGIVRVGVCSWFEIYERMKKSQNVQLLFFLILLKNNDSLFLKPPESFHQLELFFPQHTLQTKQILLEYYYIQNTQPPINLIAQVLNQQPQLLVPFILEHKIANLSEDSKQLLTEYWKDKDQRIVEELIMSGSQHGWELAVNHGWMRALWKMVSMGMEVDLPLGKLSSFIMSLQQQLQSIEDEQQSPQMQMKISNLETQMKNYALQMSQYIILTLQHFLDPQQISQPQDLKDFLLTLLRPQIMKSCFKYQPIESAKIISKIFKQNERVEMIDSFPSETFIDFHKQFKHIIKISYPLIKNSESLFSHISQIYNEMTQQKSIPAEQRQKYKQSLFIEHAKIISFSMSPGTERFHFTKSYLLDMLLALVSHNNQQIKQLVHQEFIHLQRERDQLESYIQDLLVKIWENAKLSAVEESEEEDEAEIGQQQIRDFLATLQQANGSNNYLFIWIMLELPPGQFCVKILRKFIYCQNILIKERIFDWLMKAMEDENCQQLLQSELMNHLKSIIEINKSKSRILFDVYFKNKEKEIIKKIDNDPHLQLEYLEMIIDDASQNQIDIQEYYLNLYLKLLVAVEPERVIEVLEDSVQRSKGQKIKYDMQEALKISLELEDYSYKNRLETYLFEKLGDVEKCIGSYLKILGELFWEYIDLYETKEQKNPSTTTQNNANKTEDIDNNENSQIYDFSQTRKVSKKLSLITQVISSKNYSQTQNRIIEIQQEIQKEFHQLTNLIFRQSIKKYDYIKIPLDAMVTYTESIKLQNLSQKNKYLGMISFYFGIIIVQAFEKGYLAYFNEWIKNQSKLDLNLLKKHLIQGYLKIKSQENLLNNIRVIDQTVLIQNIKEILKSMEKSVYCEAKCTICGEEFVEYGGDSVMFNCGHIFHQNCIEQEQNEQDYCWECINQDQMQAMIDHTQIDMVSILNKYSRKKNTKVVLNETLTAPEPIISISKKRSNRLAIFDKKMSSIENQAEIIDMKLEILQYYESINKNY